MRRRVSHSLPAVVAGSFLLGAATVRANVDLEWRPVRQEAYAGDTVEIGLYAVSDSGFDQSVGAVNVILAWDPSILRLSDNVDPCDGDPCPPNTYDWLNSGFPDDSLGDGLNVTFSDGDAVYLALSALSGRGPAIATDVGLLVTTFQFEALGGGTGMLRFQDQAGTGTVTRVVDGQRAGLDVTGTLGAAAEVLIGECQPPTVEAIGSRYLAVNPPASAGPVALLLTGDGADDSVSCLSLHVQGDGTLAASAFFQTSAEWGAVHVTGTRIRPSTTYGVQTVCVAGPGHQIVSAPASATTWQWGDVDGNGAVFIDDVQWAMDAVNGIFHGGVWENFDLSPCLPDGAITDEDVSSVQAAVAGNPFPCEVPCPAGPNLETFAAFRTCMEGPAAGLGVECEPHDGDGDGDVDLNDFAAFQRAFGGPWQGSGLRTR